MKRGSSGTASLTGPKSSPLPYILVGLSIVAVMFGGLGTWAALAPLDGAIIAQGVVTVFSKRKTVQHLEGGIVSEILVRDGDYVEAGQLLLRLDDTRVNANLAIVDGKLDVLRTREARLIAERDRETSVSFPVSLVERETNLKLADTLRGERELFAARAVALKGEIEILGQKVQQFKKQIEGLEAQRRAKGAQLELIVEEVMGLRQLYEKGYAPKTRILALERTAEQLAGERGEHVAEIARARNSINEAELQKIQVEKEFRQEVVAELQTVQAEILDMEERRVAVDDEFRRVDVRAPQAGNVVGLDVHTVGGVIGAAQSILEIVPLEDELVIEANVQPQDIDKVAAGLVAVVRLSAFNLRNTPELNGTVFTASADSLVDQATGTPFYLVGIRIDPAELTKLEGLELRPGMPAEVFVNTGERTALSYLLKPLADGLARAMRDDG